MASSLLCVVVIFLSAISASPADKVSPEEVIAKSIEAFGPADVRSPATRRELDCRVAWRMIVGGAGALEGSGIVQTRGEKFHYHADFNNSVYPSEDIVYRGEGRPVIGQVTPGHRSVLGDFIFTNPVLLRNGLLGGVYNSAWPLFHFEKSGAKLTFRGTKKLDNKKVNEFEYQGPNQGDTKIYLYFDTETNQHVMTEYHALQPASLSGISQANGRDTVTVLQERFSEFRQVFGMNIPLVWTIRYTQQEGAVQQWQMTLQKQKLDVPEEAFAPKP
jgi:hypothetical protein